MATVGTHQNPIQAKLPATLSINGTAIETRVLFTIDASSAASQPLWTFVEESEEFNWLIRGADNSQLVQYSMCFSAIGEERRKEVTSQFQVELHNQATEKHGINYGGWLSVNRGGKTNNIYLPGERTYDVGGPVGCECVTLDFLTFELAVIAAQLRALHLYSSRFVSSAEKETYVLNCVRTAAKAQFDKQFLPRLPVSEWIWQQIVCAAVKTDMSSSPNYLEFVDQQMEAAARSAAPTSDIVKQHEHGIRFLQQVKAAQGGSLHSESVSVLPPAEYFRRVDVIDPNAKFSLAEKDFQLFLQITSDMKITPVSASQPAQRQQPAPASSASSASTTSVTTQAPAGIAGPNNAGNGPSPSPSSSSSSSSPQQVEHLLELYGAPPPSRPILDEDLRETKKVANISRSINLNVKEGFLYKQGKIRKNWKFRYFVLKPDGLYYFANPNEYTPQGVMPINKLDRVEKLSESAVELLKPPSVFLALHHQFENMIKFFFLFKVVVERPGGKQPREYFMAATSMEEREEWVKLLLDTIRLRDTNRLAESAAKSQN